MVQIRNIQNGFLVVAASAQDLQVSGCVLPAVEGHALRCAETVVDMPLRNDAVKLQLLGGGALGTTSSQFEEERESGVFCPDGWLLRHQIHSPSMYSVEGFTVFKGASLHDSKSCNAVNNLSSVVRFSSITVATA